MDQDDILTQVEQLVCIALQQNPYNTLETFFLTKNFSVARKPFEVWYRQVDLGWGIQAGLTSNTFKVWDEASGARGSECGVTSNTFKVWKKDKKK